MSSYQTKKDAHEELRKRVNFTVDANIQDMEQKYESLLKNQKDVEKDKTEIMNDMVELDIKKKESLEKCFLGVSENFRKIFEDLLKGATAKLSKM